MQNFSSILRLKWAAVIAFAFVAPCIATSRDDNVIHQTRNTKNQDWLKLGRLDYDTKLSVRIGLVQDMLAEGHDLLMDISDPDSPDFGKHLTLQEVYEFFAPDQERVHNVRQWLIRNGIEEGRISQSANKQWIELEVSSHQAEVLLETTYYLFEYTPTGETTIACDQYNVPRSVQQHIDYILPGTRLLANERISNSRYEKRNVDSRIFRSVYPCGEDEEGVTEPLLNCDKTITPKCIMSMYGIDPATSAVQGNELGIFESLGQRFSQEDLDHFFSHFYPAIPPGTSPILKGVDGGIGVADVFDAGSLSNLDLQITYPLIYPQRPIIFQTDDPVYQAAGAHRAADPSSANYTSHGYLNTFLDAIDGSYCDRGGRTALDPQYPHNVPGGFKEPLQCGVYKPTNVISISYGGQEWDFDINYQKRQCMEYMKLGLQGTSVLVASGDDGVAGPKGDGNINGCLNGTLGIGTVFSPDFPANCPYVTVVGATRFSGDSYRRNETAVTRFGSGGGFSNIFGTPDYQKRAVAAYLHTHAPPYPFYGAAGQRDGLFNASGRAYPDVSAIGDNVAIFNQGQFHRIGGTPASTQVLAAIITRINNERLRLGKKSLGFLNPTLYKNPQVFYDVVTGDNPGCSTRGFAAAPGWDPVTGLGTPNYHALLDVFTNLL